jgi:hypothetical protein
MIPGDLPKLGQHLYGGAKPLYTEPDGATAIDGYGPAFQVWAADIQKGTVWSRNDS